MTDLTMKGTKGRDASPKHAQRGNGPPISKAPKGVGLTGVGTPMGGEPPEAKPKGGPTGSIDPAMFNVDHHAVRAMSNYWEGKRAGPDWLHKRIEAAVDARHDASAGMMASVPRAVGLPSRRAYKR